VRLALVAFALAAMLTAAVVGCGGATAASRRAALELDDLVPDGYSSLVRLRPRALLAEDATMRVALAIVPLERLDAFRDRHGVDPRELEQVSIASYEQHTVLLASGSFHSSVVVSEIGHRMAPLESSADSPVLRRAGIYRMRRFELLAVGAHEVALVDGPPALSGLVLHTRSDARGEPEPDSSENRNEPGLRALVRSEASAPFVYVLHGRPDLPPEGVGLLLARLEDAVFAVAAVGPRDPGALELRARLLGEFPPGADENFRALVASLPESDLGRAVGLEEAARSLAIDSLDHEIRLTASVRASTLARGLRVLFGAEIDEMLDDAT
jgi:hypothetical protein